MRTAILVTLVGSQLMLSIGCSQATTESRSMSSCSVEPTAHTEWTEHLRTISAEYSSWARVSDYAGFAPTLCRPPVPVGMQESDSDPGSVHGKKLYYLFAKNANEYPFMRYEWFGSGHRDGGREVTAEDPTSWKQPIGQVVVKQSFKAITATRAEAEAALTDSDRTGSRSIPSSFAEETMDDGVKHIAKVGEPAGLFVMMKTDPANPDTDEGWVYGTV